MRRQTRLGLLLLVLVVTTVLNVLVGNWTISLGLGLALIVLVNP